MLQRTAHHRAHQIAPVVGAGLVIHQRLNGLGRGFGCGTKSFVAWRLAVKCGFGLLDASRRRLGAANANMNIRS